MTYIPDYRKETDKLNEKDRRFIAGYRAAMEDAKCFFDNGDIYNASEEEEKVLSEEKECFEDWADREEIMTVLSLFEGDEYEDLELKDGNENPYINIRRNQNGKL